MPYTSLPQYYTPTRVKYYQRPCLGNGCARTTRKTLACHGYHGYHGQPMTTEKQETNPRRLRTWKGLPSTRTTSLHLLPPPSRCRHCCCCCYRWDARALVRRLAACPCGETLSPESQDRTSSFRRGPPGPGERKERKERSQRKREKKAKKKKTKGKERKSKVLVFEGGHLGPGERKKSKERPQKKQRVNKKRTEGMVRSQKEFGERKERKERCQKATREETKEK